MITTYSSLLWAWTNCSPSFFMKLLDFIKFIIFIYILFTKTNWHKMIHFIISIVYCTPSLWDVATCPILTRHWSWSDKDFLPLPAGHTGQTGHISTQINCHLISSQAAQQQEMLLKAAQIQIIQFEQQSSHLALLNRFQVVQLLFQPSHEAVYINPTHFNKRLSGPSKTVLVWKLKIQELNA